MIPIAVLSEQVSSQLTAPEAPLSAELERIDVVWTGTSLQELQKRAPQLPSTVLLVELGLLGESPRKLLDKLLATTQAELALVLYHFAPREAVQRLQGERSRPIKAPAQPDLAADEHAPPLLIRDTLHKSSPSAEAESPAAISSQELRPVLMPALTQGQAPPSRANRVHAPVIPRVRTHPARQRSPRATRGRYRQAVLTDAARPPARVPTRQSSASAQATWPSLSPASAAFEDYSKACENKNDSDAAMHARLYRDSSHARRLLEESLQALCKFENITP